MAAIQVLNLKTTDDRALSLWSIRLCQPLLLLARLAIEKFTEAPENHCYIVARLGAQWQCSPARDAHARDLLGSELPVHLIAGLPLAPDPRHEGVESFALVTLDS